MNKIWQLRLPTSNNIRWHGITPKQVRTLWDLLKNTIIPLNIGFHKAFTEARKTFFVMLWSIMYTKFCYLKKIGFILEIFILLCFGWIKSFKIYNITRKNKIALPPALENDKKNPHGSRWHFFALSMCILKVLTSSYSNSVNLFYNQCNLINWILNWIHSLKIVVTLNIICLLSKIKQILHCPHRRSPPPPPIYHC